MKTSSKSLKVLSLSAVSAALTAALLMTPALAGDVGNAPKGWLSEYEIQPGEVLPAPYRPNPAVDNAPKSWLSEYEIQPGEVLPAPYRPNPAVDNAPKSWLSEYEIQPGEVLPAPYHPASAASNEQIGMAE